MKRRIVSRQRVLGAVMIVLACIAVWRTWDYRRQERLNSLGGRLHDAVRRENVEEIEHLFALGAPAESTIRYWTTPLLAAVMRGADAAVIVALIENGADVNARYENTGPLSVATHRDDPRVAYVLLDRGADVTARDKYGRTPLMHAITFNADVALVIELLNRGSDVNAADVDGWTPLIHAAHWSTNADVVAVLVARGADVHHVDYDGLGPVRHAHSMYPFGSVQVDRSAIVDLLVAHSAATTGATPPLPQGAAGPVVPPETSTLTNLCSRLDVPVVDTGSPLPGASVWGER